MSDNKELEPQLELVLVEKDKTDRLDELTEQYNRLNAKCDLILEKIRNRKKKVANA